MNKKEKKVYVELTEKQAELFLSYLNGMSACLVDAAASPMSMMLPPDSLANSVSLLAMVSIKFRRALGLPECECETGALAEAEAVVAAMDMCDDEEDDTQDFGLGFDITNTN